MNEVGKESFWRYRMSIKRLIQTCIVEAIYLLLSDNTTNFDLIYKYKGANEVLVTNTYRVSTFNGTIHVINILVCST